VVAALLACLLLVWVTVSLVWTPGEIRSQRLEDGSLLALTRVKFGTTNVFIHGNLLEKVLGNLIPARGVHVPFTPARFRLDRPKKQRPPAGAQPRYGRRIQAGFFQPRGRDK
jgi:hypothetical protein